jgi:hypothetical protein
VTGALALLAGGCAQRCDRRAPIAARQQPVRQALPGGGRPLYARINLSAGFTFYVRFNESTLRYATTADDLSDAPSVSGRKTTSGEIEFPEIAVSDPAPRAKGPEKVRARFVLGSMWVGSRREAAAWALLGLCRPDAHGSLWTCWFSLMVPLGDSVEHCRALDLPDPADLKLDVVAKAEGRTVGIGVRVMAGSALLAGIHRDDKPVEAQLVVRGPDGKVIVSESGPLAKFGFG